MSKPVNYLAQTGALEDLVWSIMNDAETEAHYDRLIQSFKRDLKATPDEQEQEYHANEISKAEQYKQSVRQARYSKTNIALALANKVAGVKAKDKYSCIFKHQLLSMAEMRDSLAVIDDDNLLVVAEEAYDLTVTNASISIAEFLGLEVESCMACLFEKNKIEKAVTE
ncbi:hypothetical protein BG262_02900 [Floricoccus penangensis]|uniref:Uncharacterized protein n=1 Tax=Floricoccus penangensis TaxID=1859475 RepID=A0A9Q5NZM8_9LACT|nr:hypothetical protein [Floricoccus penangensis]OFI46763.1 hypothetical protein BG262_02900 [Floricoccus penangensis]